MYRGEGNRPDGTFGDLHREEVLGLVRINPERAFLRVVRKLQALGSRAYLNGKPVDISYQTPQWRMTGATLKIKSLHSDTLWPLVKDEDESRQRAALMGSLDGPYEVKMVLHYDSNAAYDLAATLSWEEFWHLKGGSVSADEKSISPGLFVATAFALKNLAPQPSGQAERDGQGNVQRRGPSIWTGGDTEKRIEEMLRSSSRPALPKDSPAPIPVREELTVFVGTRSKEKATQRWNRRMQKTSQSQKEKGKKKKRVRIKKDADLTSTTEPDTIDSTIY